MKLCPKCSAENSDKALACQRCETPLGAVAQPSRVTVVDVDMPFGSMVSFMVKWAIATIPAFLILFVLGVFLVAIFGAAL